MRTTVTLEPDVAALIDKDMRARGVSFKRAINDAIRLGLGGQAETAPYVVRARSMGRPAVPLTKALQVAAELEDEEILRKLSLGK
ncbi:MAG: antitoxin [Actinomycetota bacterium]|nr:antitoxin [Actinomycetota bacterium]